MMNRGKRLRSFAVRFELGIGGMCGLTVVCLCIFLWVFLLGVWAGQTVLSPSSSDEAPWLHRVATRLLPAPTVPDTPPTGQDLQGAPTAPAPAIPVGPNADAQIDQSVEAEPAPGAIPGEANTPATGKGDAAATDATTCFALQVGAFREEVNAAEAVAAWKEKGYVAFSLPPQEGSHLHRVFVGRFADLGAANKLVTELEEKEQVRAYITLIPEGN